ncbi:hypothetical protein KKB99_06380, partial [bacterium]|nr:hypothetical protein [bacterium]MBU1025615.1 hypothetical protein [bacterium]
MLEQEQTLAGVVRRYRGQLFVLGACVIVLASFPFVKFLGPLPIIIFYLLLLSVVLFTINPKLVLIVLLMIRPLLDIPKIFGIRMGAGINLAGAVAVALIVFTVIYKLMGNVKIREHSFTPPYAIFMVLTLMVFIVFSQPDWRIMGIGNWLRYLTYPLIIVLVANEFKDNRSLMRTLKLITAAGILPIIFAFVLHVGLGRYLTTRPMPRFSGSFLHAVSFGIYLMFIMLCCLYFLIRDKLKLKIF